MSLRLPCEVGTRAMLLGSDGRIPLDLVGEVVARDVEVRGRELHDVSWRLVEFRFAGGRALVWCRLGDLTEVGEELDHGT